MKIKNKFNEEQLKLLQELNIEIKEDYNIEDLEELEEKVSDAMLENLDKKQDFTPRAEEIEHILDVIVDIENKLNSL